MLHVVAGASWRRGTGARWPKRKATNSRNTFPSFLMRFVRPIPTLCVLPKPWPGSERRIEVPAEDLTRFVQNGTQSIFENDVHWARFYLVKAGLLGNARRGLWNLTAEGREARLSPEETWELYVQIRDANRPGSPTAEEDAPAPGIAGDSEEVGKSYWFVGSVWNGNDDQLPRFREQGVWENGYEDQFLDLVRRIRPGIRSR